jgi:DNA-binding IclR family transcriptional regulator
MGRACLGELDGDEVQRLASHQRLGDDSLLRDIEEDAHKGFGQRTEGHWEYPVRLPFLIRAIALPVRVEGQLAGSIALHWPVDQAPVERVLSLHLDQLAATVGQVQHALEA